ncbi:peptide ABC transporter substrate-binding protein [Agrobacterium vitis]|uniref:Peptide ABC transporter substrate-binding protein n=2 Tax=Agrobacterium vitis TaxID=373 RepID=A0AAE4WDF1_AGRVI|nr:peptide ABC transporter substrate-binding protein [Allorhizobium sp. Av2]MCM2442878.1 peptide ABC transporter substrate-binding protein [Agrobacterium vitis]MUZ58816.1 peptide ABC transporter substrate-binding protein [Agrobacterium vitis]MVA66451.1 peptide ABC transporter substrate-binding protein [Agrobacterium vitis]MVA88488.1 peptide ABC transporter substrate-binding protein [Agrobacterium vitis]
MPECLQTGEKPSIEGGKKEHFYRSIKSQNAAIAIKKMGNEIVMKTAIKRRNFIKAGASLAAFGLLGDFANQAMAKSVEGGTLKIGTSNELNYNMLCFAMTGGPYDYVYSWPIYESLFKPNANGTIDPWLAESVESDAKALTYAIHIRRGVTFSDGSVLNATVVKWNLDHYLKVGAKRVALLGSITSVDVVDDYTVRLVLSKWSSFIPAALSRECGYMFSQQHYEKYGDDYCQQHPVGTGPFVLKEWVRDVSKSFVRNEHYWGGKVLLEAVQYTIYNDSLVGQAALMSDEIDVMIGLGLNGVKTLAANGFDAPIEPLQDHASLLVFNSLNTSNDDPMGNLLVRQAISHAINRKSIIEAAFLGYADVASQFGIGSHFVNKDIVGYDYNVAKAKELLAKAGFPQGFSTKIQAAASDTNKIVLQIMQADLAKVGIQAKIELLTGAASNKAETGWGSGMWYHTSSVYVDVAMQMSSMFPKGLTGGVLGLTTMLRPDDVSDALARAVSSTSDAESVKAVGEANKMMIDTYALYVPIAQYSTIYVLSKRVKASGIGATFFSVASLSSAYLDT